MNGPSIGFLSMVGLAAMGISWLTFTLTRRVFEMYRRPRLIYIYWSVNLLAVLGVLFGRGRLDTFSFSAGLIQLVVLWFMCQVIALLLLPFYFLLRRGIERMAQGETAEVDLNRRKLIKRAALSLPAAALGISAYGTFSGSYSVQFTRHDIHLPDLDRALENFKIAQLSDVHLGLFFSVDRLRRELNNILREQPDVLVITGDLIDDVTVIDDTVAALDSFSERFPRGIYFSWGNHEYFRDFAKIQRALRGSEIKTLRNQSALLVGAEKPLYLAGVDYPWAKDGAAQDVVCRRMMENTLREVPQDATKILLSHHPMLIDYAYENGIDLTLAGHTHGGQVAILGQPLLPVRYKYMRGLYQQGKQYGYVNVGAGSWFPFRIGCPAEITFFTLKRG